MPNGGRLSISTYLDDPKIQLVIKDQGSGFTEEVLNNIGSPFLTTKENGTGLGLSVCYSIVAHHNASMKFESSPKGTSVYIDFDRP